VTPPYNLLILLLLFLAMSSETEYLKGVREDNEIASKNERKIEDAVPVICSKCNTTFGSDSEYMQHYDIAHKPENTN
jgi:hypothetical protein